LGEPPASIFCIWSSLGLLLLRRSLIHLADGIGLRLDGAAIVGSRSRRIVRSAPAASPGLHVGGDLGEQAAAVH
jgi:hypothetical protein